VEDDKGEEGGEKEPGGEGREEIDGAAAAAVFWAITASALVR